MQKKRKKKNRLRTFAVFDCTAEVMRNLYVCSGAIFCKIVIFNNSIVHMKVGRTKLKTKKYEKHEFLFPATKTDRSIHNS